MFTQIIDPLGNLTMTCLVALIPVVFLLVLLAVFRVSAWLAVLLGFNPDVRRLPLRSGKCRSTSARRPI